jgi:acetoin utilization deacetylase AcuC-like enzyme
MKAFYCDHFVLPLPETHSFPMTKYRKLRERVIADGIIDPADLVEPHAASRDELCLAHDPADISDVCEGRLTSEQQRRIGFPWSPAMAERARRSVGGTIGAARLAPVEGAAVNLAGGTHHAFRDRGAGYCVFNDVAVAARVVQRDAIATGSTPPRIVVIDCDVHQGDGTAAIFQGDSSVFTLSLHAEKNFPFKKETSDLDIMLPDGTRDDDYLERLLSGVEEALGRQRPDLVFYLAGADPYEGDRLGRLKLTVNGLQARDRLVIERCHGIPIAACMGGGYCADVDTIAVIHSNTVRELTRVAAVVRS